MRVGIGYDIHRLVVDRPCILGGVNIAHEKGLLGHSDADVLLHAMSDALLGAASLGNIGQHFPDTDMANKGLDSRFILQKSNELIRNKGFEISNIDATIIAQKPYLNDYLPQMISNISKILDIPISSVSVKATTNEGIGTIGRGEGIATIAIALLHSQSP